jgi:hypothetical protein
MAEPDEWPHEIHPSMIKPIRPGSLRTLVRNLRQPSAGTKLIIEFRKTEAQRQGIKDMKALGAGVPEIARALGIPEDSLLFCDL